MFEENIIETEVSSNIVETESDSLIGTPGIDGVTFTPSVSQEGIISWTNNGGLSNPTPINIKGDKGDKGEQGIQGIQGIQGPKGEPGEKGEKGDKGPKGEKGDTYTLTEQDKQDISNMTVESSESTFNQYYNGKLEDFNSNATSKVNEYNTNADNKIAEYDLHSQELNNKIIATRNELERVKNDVLETGTDTDTYIHLQDSAMAEYQELSVDGVCEQVTTTGKNLLKSNLLPITKNGITISENDNGDIVVNGTITGISSGYVSFFIGDVFTVEEGTYTSSVQNKKNGIGLNTAGFGGALNITMADNVNFKTATATETQIINPQINIRYDAGTFNNYIFNPILEKSSSATSYEPYTGGQPSPSPEFPQPISTIENSLKITSCNKNLLDNDKLRNSDFQINVYRYNQTNIIGNRKLYFKAKLKEGKTAISKLYVCLGSKVHPNISGSEHAWSINNGTIVNSSSSYVRNYMEFTSNTPLYFSYYPNNISVEDLFDTYEFSVLVSDDEVEQHLETQIIANLPEGEFIGKISDTYKDTLKVEYNEDDGQHHLNLYKRVYKNNSYNGESYNYYISTTARKDGNIECGELQTGQVVYYVGDETIIDLGVVDMPITYNEITNLFTDNDLLPTINAKYYRNFISTVRNLQVNEKALKQELIDINTRLSALESANTSVASESEVVE